MMVVIKVIELNVHTCINYIIIIIISHVLRFINESILGVVLMEYMITQRSYLLLG